eukprot:1188311-Prorocentrum_minimum.AAC.1
MAVPPAPGWWRWSALETKLATRRPGSIVGFTLSVLASYYRTALPTYRPRAHARVQPLPQFFIYDLCALGAPAVQKPKKPLPALSERQPSMPTVRPLSRPPRSPGVATSGSQSASCLSWSASCLVPLSRNASCLNCLEVQVSKPLPALSERQLSSPALSGRQLSSPALSERQLSKLPRSPGVQATSRSLGAPAV